MKDEIGENIIKEFGELRAKTAVKIKKQKAQNSMSQKENLNLKIIKAVQKQINLKMK